MSYTDGPRGIGGWLAFFLVTLGIFSPLAELVGTVSQMGDPELPLAYGDRWPAVRASAWTLSIASILICWFIVGMFLLVRKWSTVRIGIVSLWLLCILNVVIAPFAVAWFGGIPFGALLGAMGPALVRPVIYSTIWTAYLLKSERVENTYRYPDGGDEAELAQVFD